MVDYFGQPYTADFQNHDKALLASLQHAEFVEQELDNGSRHMISLAHLHGWVSFCDGVMYWSVNDKGGEKAVDQRDIDASARYCLNYGRKAVKNNLLEIKTSLIAEISARLESVK